jgi:hypothetical protein
MVVGIGTRAKDQTKKVPANVEWLSVAVEVFPVQESRRQMDGRGHESPSTELL